MLLAPVRQINLVSASIDNFVPICPTVWNAVGQRDTGTKKAALSGGPFAFIPRFPLRRDLQFLAGIDLIRVMKNISVGVPDRLPRYAIFGADLAEAVAGFDGVGVRPAAGRIAAGVDVQDQIAGAEIGVKPVVLIPKLLFRLGVGAVPVTVRTPLPSLSSYVVPFWFAISRSD